MRLALLMLALLTSPALAQETTTALSPDAAFQTSLWGTLLPVAAGTTILLAQGGGDHDHTGGALLVWSGSLFGPSMGYMGAGLGGRGLRGIGLRAGIEFVSLAAAMGVCGWYCTDDQETGASLILLSGFVLVAASDIYDISRVRHNVERHNARAQRLSLAPFYSPGRATVGLRGSISF